MSTSPHDRRQARLDRNAKVRQINRAKGEVASTAEPITTIVMWGSKPRAENDNHQTLVPSIDLAVPGQALSLNQPHRRFGRCYAEFVRHAGDGKHVVVRKLISGMWKGRWTKPMKVDRSLVRAVHTNMARGADQVAA